LDKYVGEHFVGTSAHKHMMKSLRDSLVQTEDGGGSRITSTLKAIEYLFHFIIKSRLLYVAKNTSIGQDEDAAFRKELGEVLIFFNSIMKISNPKFRGAQAMALKSFGHLSVQIRKIFFGVHFANIVKSFLECISGQTHDPTMKHLNSEKLTYIRKVTHLQYSEGETQQIVYTAVAAALMPHLRSTAEEEKSDAISIIIDVLHKLETTVQSPLVASSIVAELGKTIPLLLVHFNFFKEEKSKRDDLTAFISIFNLLTYDQLLSLCRSLDGINTAITFTKILSSTMAHPMYPDTWTKLIIFMHQTILDTSTKLFVFVQAESSAVPAAPNARRVAGEARSRTLNLENSRHDFYVQLFLLVSAFIRSGLLNVITDNSRDK